MNISRGILILKLLKKSDCSENYEFKNDVMIEELLDSNNDLSIWGKEVEIVCPEKDNGNEGIVLVQNMRYKHGMSMRIEIDDSYKMVVNEFDIKDNVLRTINIYDEGKYSR